MKRGKMINWFIKLSISNKIALLSLVFTVIALFINNYNTHSKKDKASISIKTSGDDSPAIVNIYGKDQDSNIELNKKKSFLSILDLITLGTNKEYVESLLGVGRKESNSKTTFTYSKDDFVIKIQYNKNKNVTYIILIPKTLDFANKFNIGRFIHSDKPLFFSKATIGVFTRDTIYEDEKLESNSGGSGNCVNYALYSYKYSTHRFAIPYPIEVGYQASDCLDDLDLGESNYMMTDKDDSLVQSTVTSWIVTQPDGTEDYLFPVENPKLLLEALQEVNINYIAIGTYKYN